jgi:CRP-like cAMP-binding protein
MFEAKPQSVQVGGRTSSEGHAISNFILLALPEAEFQLLRPLLTFQLFQRGTRLYEPGEKLEFVDFPNRGLVGLVVATRDEKTVEVGVVGREGLIGTPALFGLNQSPHFAVVQVAGDGFRVQVDALRNALPSSSYLTSISSRHAVIQGMQAAQSAACNRLHGLEQRLARWLLILQDQINNPPLHLTHDSLAMMLGTDRPSVSLAAGMLQKKGLITYTRGAVRIINRRGLEEAACECYGVMQQFNGFLGLRPMPNSTT